MILEMRQLGESLEADFTGKRFFAGVNELVPLELGRSGELFAAVGTLMSTVVGAATVGSGSHLQVEREG